MSKSVILIVEDDPSIRRALSEGLRDSGYEVVAAATAEEALSKLAVIVVDLALVDLKLPGMDGVNLLRELRQRSPTTELVIMSANPSTDSAIEALRMDAYDYLLKPFTLDQVEQVLSRALERHRQWAHRETLLRQLERSLAGLQALKRSGSVGSPASEAKSRTNNPGMLFCGPIEIDLQRHLARAEERELDLTPTEFNLLVTLVDRAPAVVSHQDLIHQAIGYQTDPIEARELVKWHIHHLRGKVESDPKRPRYIVNVRGVGYRLAGS